MLKLFARLEIERVVDRAKAHERNNEFIFTIKTIYGVLHVCINRNTRIGTQKQIKQKVCLSKIPFGKAQPNEMTETDGSST